MYDCNHWMREPVSFGLCREVGPWQVPYPYDN
jgi:hypothetical protein